MIKSRQKGDFLMELRVLRYFLAVAREDRGFQVAAVSRGARAAVVKYTGNGDLADHLDEVMAMVQ